MLSKEQMDALPGLVADKWSMEVNDEYMEGNVWDGEGDLICTVYCRRDVEKVTKLIALAPSLAAAVIEQQAEIERLRGIVRELIEMLDYDRTSERYRVAVDAAYSEIDQ